MLFTLLVPWLQSRYYHHRGCKLPVMKKCQALFELFTIFLSLEYFWGSFTSRSYSVPQYLATSSLLVASPKTWFSHHEAVMWANMFCLATRSLTH